MAIGADDEASQDGLIPVRMVSEFAYCPRLFHLEYVEREFTDNAYTVQGRSVHTRVDKGSGRVPSPESEAEFAVKSVSLSSAALGLSGKIDVVEGEGGAVQPVDYKRGAPGEEGPYEPERVQLCAYGLLLREHGYRCDRGFLYYAQIRRRVEIVFDDALVTRTRELVAAAREAATKTEIPPPLEASPKCPNCSLVGVCLPDEVTLLRAPSQQDKARPRQILVPADEAKPLYVQAQGSRIGIDGHQLRIRDMDGKTVLEKRFPDVSQVVVFGNVQISAQALQELFRREIPVCWMSYGGWLAGLTEGLGHGNVDLRRTQFRRADDGAFCLGLAKRIVRTKIANSRTLLRRNHAGDPALALREMQRAMEALPDAGTIDSVLGLEGNAARLYFQNFSGMFKQNGKHDFDFEARSRRPPKDPVNALLSFAYSLLAKEFTLAVRTVGLDPFLGFYHQTRHGRPALALDLMEEFRPLIADSVVLNVLNTNVVDARDFVGCGLGVALAPDARRKVLAAFERRMEEEITHPVFGYPASYRRVIAIQCRLFARFLAGEVSEFPEFKTR